MRHGIIRIDEGQPRAPRTFASPSAYIATTGCSSIARNRRRRHSPLYERVEGLFARRQMAARPALVETSWIRDLGLRVMAGQA